MKRTGLGVCLALLLASPASAERYPVLTPDQMTPQQRAVAGSIMATRKNLDGPFNPWLRSPELADRFQKVGEYVRYNTSLSKPQSEFAILITARYWTSQAEWAIHYPAALAAGVPASVLDDLAVNKRPRGMSADETLIYDFCMGLHEGRGRLPDALFDAAKARLGDKGVMDLIGLNGYYDAVAMTINAAQMPLPGGARPPLQ
jgi:4-carboxymuconolactone decarboxylase